MRFNPQPDTPRPLARTGAMVAPGQDARWRGLPEGTVRADRLTTHLELRRLAQIAALAKVGR